MIQIGEKKNKGMPKIAALVSIELITPSQLIALDKFHENNLEPLKLVNATVINKGMYTIFI